MDTKTRIRPDSKTSGRAPLARFSDTTVTPVCDQQRQQPIPSPSKHRLLVASEHSRKKFGQKIQALREQLGLSHEQVSQECGLTMTRLKLIEAGQADIRLFTIIALAEKLKTTTEDLLKEIE